MDEDSQNELDQNITNFRGLAACITVLLYDILLNLALEANHIWKRRKTGATVLFYLNRHLYPISILLSIAAVHTSTETSCKGLTYAARYFEIFAQTITAVINAARVWAIWGQRLTPFLFVLAMGLVVPFTGIYRAAAFHYKPQTSLPPEWGACQWIWTHSTGTLKLSIWINQWFGTVSIFTVLIATWIKTYRIRRRASRNGHSPGLRKLLFRDGSVYFFVIFVISMSTTVVNQVTDVDGGLITRPDGEITQGSNLTLNMIDTIHCIIISRFFLNLRSFDQTVLSPSPENDQIKSTTSSHQIVSQNVLGNIGAPLDEGDGDGECEDDDARGRRRRGGRGEGSSRGRLKDTDGGERAGEDRQGEWRRGGWHETGHGWILEERREEDVPVTTRQIVEDPLSAGVLVYDEVVPLSSFRPRGS